ncbi:MAG: DUF692 family protein [bacterium]|nr:DUF692 family protein [bacterium]
MAEIALPISHLFNETGNISCLLKYSDCLECRDSMINCSLDNQDLFHCELQPVHFFSEKHIEFLKKIRKLKPGLKLISFHMASVCDEPFIKNSVFEPGGKEFSRKELLENAKQNFIKIKEIFGSYIRILVENNNYYPTDAYKYITDADFISEIVYDNDINFLFDIAHAKITALNKNINYQAYLNKLPLKKTVQVHLSKHAFDEKACDAHDLPDADDIAEMMDFVRKYNIRYITPEYYKNIDTLIELLKNLRQQI